MNQTAVKIQLNNNIDKGKLINSKQTNNKCSELTKIIISFAILIFIIVFILILLFVIIKVQDKDEDKLTPVIFDVDEGSDDMLAYIVANNSKKYNILGITIISLFYNIEDVGNIWLRFLEYMHFDNKVYLGENDPLMRSNEKNPFSHNYGFVLAYTKKKYEKKGAVDFIYETLKKKKNYNICFGTFNKFS